MVRFINSPESPGSNENFIVPRESTVYVRGVFTFINIHADILFTTRTKKEYLKMIRRFEQEHLGLPPADSEDGLYWWGSADGIYPAEPVAALVDMSSAELLDHINSNKGTAGWIVIKSANYLIPVTNSSTSNDSVIIDSIKELTPEGEELLATILDL